MSKVVAYIITEPWGSPFSTETWLLQSTVRFCQHNRAAYCTECWKMNLNTSKANTKWCGSTALGTIVMPYFCDRRAARSHSLYHGNAHLAHSQLSEHWPAQINYANPTSAEESDWGGWRDSKRAKMRMRRWTVSDRNKWAERASKNREWWGRENRVGRKRDRYCG